MMATMINTLVLPYRTALRILVRRKGCRPATVDTRMVRAWKKRDTWSKEGSESGQMVRPCNASTWEELPGGRRLEGIIVVRGGGRHHEAKAPEQVFV